MLTYLVYKAKKSVRTYAKYLRLFLFLSIVYTLSYLTTKNITQKYIYLSIQYLNQTFDNIKQYAIDSRLYFLNLKEKSAIINLEHKKSLDLESEIKKISLEKQILEQENVSLKKLLNFFQNQNNELKIFSTKAFINQNNLFSNSGVIYTKGLDVKINDFVLSNNGLLGIVYSVGTIFAKFNLITHPDVRLSVMNINSRDLCMTLGVGSKIKLIYVNGKHNMKVGDILVTNSVNVAQNIPVAQIESINENEIFATPFFEKTNLDFVGVINSEARN